MSERFDPYLEWLGVATQQRPVNHYTLLGLPPFESDPERINAAARRQFQRLRPHMHGTCQETAQSLANEITAAGRCLLDPQAKKDYDSQLRASAPMPPPAVAPPPLASNAFPPPIVDATQPPSPPVTPERNNELPSPVTDPSATAGGVAPPRVTPRASHGNGRGQRKKQQKFQMIGHLLVPLVSLGVAWAILSFIRPGFSPRELLSPSPLHPERSLTQQEQTEQGRPMPRQARTSNSRATSNPQPQPKPRSDSSPASDTAEPPPLLEPNIEATSTPSLTFLPEAVDLPPHSLFEPATLAEPDVPIELECDLVLISDRLPEQPDVRLGLTASPASSETLSWTVGPRPLHPGDGTETEAPVPPLAKFSWENGRLHFQWQAAGDERLRTTLRNSLLNVRLGTEEKLLQLRRPLTAPSLTLDLSAAVLQTPLDIPHLPPLEQLRMELTKVDFAGLAHRLEDEKRKAKIGEKLPVFITTPPGVRFQVWVASVDQQLKFRAEGHYWLGSTTPIEFSQRHVERQTRAFFRNRRNAEAAIPRLENTIRSLKSRISTANRQLRAIPGSSRFAQARASLTLQIKGMEASVAAGRAKQEQARRTISVTSQGLEALKEVAALGNTIHEQAPFQYRIYMPFEFEGVDMEVVLLEASGREAGATIEDASAFSVDSLADTNERSAIPPEVDRRSAKAELATEYKQKYESANDAASRRRLAVTLREAAINESDDHARQFEMFRLAWNIFIQGGDLGAALETADQMEQFFEVDRLALRVTILRAAAKATSFSDRRSVVIEEILTAIDDATLTEDYDLATKLAELAGTLQETLPARRYTQEIEERVAIVEADQQLATGEAYLLDNPEDTEAHLRVGRLALRQGRPWSDYLPVLAKGDDAAIARAARADLSAPDDPVDQLALADSWYELSQSDEELQSRLEERAAKWYSEALPHLEGFSKTKAETRLESFDIEATDEEANSLGDHEVQPDGTIKIHAALETNEFPGGAKTSNDVRYAIDGSGKRGVLNLVFNSAELEWKQKPNAVKLHFYVPGEHTSESRDPIDVVYAGKVIGTGRAPTKNQWHQISLDVSQLHPERVLPLQMRLRGHDAVAIAGNASGNALYLELLVPAE